MHKLLGCASHVERVTAKGIYLLNLTIYFIVDNQYFAVPVCQLLFYCFNEMKTDTMVSQHMLLNRFRRLKKTVILFISSRRTNCNR